MLPIIYLTDGSSFCRPNHRKYVRSASAPKIPPAKVRSDFTDVSCVPLSHVYSYSATTQVGGSLTQMRETGSRLSPLKPRYPLQNGLPSGTPEETREEGTRFFVFIGRAIREVWSGGVRPERRFKGHLVGPANRSDVRCGGMFVDVLASLQKQEA